MASTTTVRIREETATALRELARTGERSIQDVLDDAVELYARRSLLDAANTAYAALRADPEAWREELEERRLWEATLADDVEDG